MTEPLIVSLTMYFAISVAGFNVSSYGLEATAAGIVGLVLTIIHFFVSEPTCTFDSYNAWASVFFLLAFIILYFTRQVIVQRGIR